jgi:D-alanyl-lipoteichoic acid acyltransferase DltB (MBOAT superfamily)
MLSTIVDYFAAIRMTKVTKQHRKKYLFLSLITNLGLLFGFKYFNFFNDSIKGFFNYFNLFYDVPYFDLLLPVGISFYTFQTLSYTIDVYNEKRDPEYHFGIFALYVSFFPQLVAGPIERSTHLIPQFHKQQNFESKRVLEGLKIIIWGYFLKLVVADRAAIYVDAIYNNQDHHSGLTLITATVCFAFQIYGDFAGYSSIAIGTAKIMGYDLMQNFNRPYLSKSIKEFWSRWHISLSTWFRDYFYIPLGGNRVVKWRWYYNLFITFLISGLWHGANWTFVIWGGLNGLYLVFAIWKNKLIQNTRFDQALPIPVQIVWTFCLTCLAWIFFRANSVGDAFEIVTKVSSLSGPLVFGIGEDIIAPYYAFIAIFLLVLLEIKHEFFNERIHFFNSKNLFVRQVSFAALVVFIILFGVFDGGQFIYFQF